MFECECLMNVYTKFYLSTKLPKLRYEPLTLKCALQVTKSLKRNNIDYITW